uniref:Uncharacterized protein n=1 Tax=Cyprinus carpio TaxID=7962 RepID=A0A8C2KBV0_CYPCA
NGEIIYSACISILTLMAGFVVLGHTADGEDGQNVLRSAARPQEAQERPAGMPRRRRNLHSRVNVQHARRPSDNKDSPVEADEDQEDGQPSEERPPAAAKVGVWHNELKAHTQFT